MTQEEFASIASVNRSAVAQWEGGFHTPRMGVIHDISDYFGIPYTALTEEGGMDGAHRNANGRIVVSDSATNGRNELLSIWNTLNEDGRNAAIAALRGIAESPAFRQDH